MSHSCGTHTIDEHFVGKKPAVRETFDALVDAATSFGPVHVYAQKTRIVFQTRSRFVAVMPRKNYLSGHLWLKARQSHPLVHNIVSLRDRDFLHNFRLATPTQIDSTFRDLLHQAFLVGCQE